MDDIDRKMLILFGSEPRIHYRELARRVGISPQAAHHRMGVLTRLGVIKRAVANISVAYLHALTVGIYGQSGTTSVEDTLNRLGESEFTRRVVIAGGNYIYVVGILRDVSELGGYVDFVKRAGDMPEPLVGIYSLDDGLPCDYPVDGAGKKAHCRKQLSRLDFRIVASLGDDARKSIADIAEEVGASPKTVKRHLDEMISDGSIEFSIAADLDAGGDHFMVMHVNLRNHADKKKVAMRILTKRYFQDQYIRTYSNLPRLLLWVFWSDQINEIRRALRETSVDDDVLSTVLNFVYLERVYTTWRDKMLEVPKPRSKRARKRDVPSRPRER